MLFDESQMKEPQPADKVAQLFGDYGDLNVFKDQVHSCYIEFYYFDQNVVKSQSIDEVI